MKGRQQQKNVLLDGCTPEGKSGIGNSPLMHSLYTVADIGREHVNC